MTTITKLKKIPLFQQQQQQQHQNVSSQQWSFKGTLLLLPFTRV
jgi:hypothetical protein